MENTYKTLKSIEKIKLPKEDTEQLILVAALSFSLQEDSFLSKDLDSSIIKNHNYLENIMKGVLEYDKSFITSYKQELYDAYRTLFPDKKKADVTFRTLLSSNRIYCYVHLFSLFLSERMGGKAVDFSIVDVIEKELTGIDNIEFIFDQSGLIPEHIKGSLATSWGRMVEFSHKVLV